VLSAGVAAGLADPGKSVYFLAEEDGTAVGQMMYTTEWSDWRNGWFWWIQSVYVRPEARRRGVFRALFEHVHQAARADERVIGLRLYVERENHVAQKTYQNMGMESAGYLVFERYPL
jgi:GNAT superfamily N-acetyltransferase